MTESIAISEQLVEALAQKPEIELRKVREYLAKMRDKDLTELDERIGAIKRRLMSMGVPVHAAGELDELRMDIEDRWTVAVESILGMLME
jgi:L-lactate utilization protein LutB